ncbi:MAG: 4Fe-4S dicluster domain-containing protein, partial [Microthrixaceae bacterium]
MSAAQKPEGGSPDAEGGGRVGEARSMKRYPDLSFEARMDTVEFRVHERAHIVVDDRKCVDCSVRGCITACPANLFVPTADGGILFNYEQCFECGTCYMVCNEEGAI